MPKVTVSSNTLFHFTDSSDHLINILTHEFRPRYCLENFEFLFRRHSYLSELAFPMNSFCDLPLSQTATHLKFYGRYDIGLTKKWGMSKGITPVIYAFKGSSLFAHLDHVFRDVAIRVQTDAPIDRHTVQSFILSFAYMKPYEGKFWRRGRYIPRVRFYNEREWRYVPPLLETDLGEYLSKEEFLNSTALNNANTELSAHDFRLSFEPNDIRYIIVSKESEILPMIASIRNIKSRFDSNRVDLLASRIISCEQIEQDF